MAEAIQTIRVDCPSCKGHGYNATAAGETMCTQCEGAGELQKDVPYKFETHGKWTNDEKAEVFGLPLSEVRDAGHSAGDDHQFDGN